jgi:hypothetical protein
MIHRDRCPEGNDAALWRQFAAASINEIGSKDRRIYRAA